MFLKLIITVAIGAFAFAGSTEAQWRDYRRYNPDYGSPTDEGDNYQQFAVSSKQGRYIGKYFLGSWSLILDIADNGDTHVALFDSTGTAANCRNAPHLLKIKSSLDKNGRALFRVQNITTGGDIEFHGVNAILDQLQYAKELTLQLRGCNTNTTIDFDLTGGARLSY